MLLPYVDSYMGIDGKIRHFGKTEADLLSEKIKKSGKRAVLTGKTDTDGKITVINAVTFSDPPKKDAAKGVAALSGAGIKVVMITGDSKENAERTARKVGIQKENDISVSGAELAKMSDSAVSQLLPKISVVYRAMPSDKERLVTISQSSGLVAGMTGDGINDAAALKKADIGFAMESGTDIAKDAGDIVILDNSVSSIGKAVLYGRTIFKNIRKFIVFQLTMNFIAVGVSVICPFFGIDTPITIMQMLWINLIMDTLGGLAFAGEAPLEEYMREKPKSRSENILNKYMVTQIAGVSVFSVSLLISEILLEDSKKAFFFYSDRPYFMTVFFCTFIFIAVVNCFNARTARMNIFAGLMKNKVFLSVIAFVITVQMIIIRYGGELFSTVPVKAQHITDAFVISLSVLFFDFLRKLLFVIGKKSRKL